MYKDFKCNGKLVIIEGTEGAGKSTLVKMMKDALEKLDPAREVILLREPGGSEQSERIRNVMFPKDKDAEDLNFDPMTEVLLFAASRRENFVRLLPELEKGNIVIIDRHMLSSIVWQGKNMPNNDVNPIFDIDAISTKDLPGMDKIKPIMFYLGIDAEKAQERRKLQKDYDANKNDRLPLEELKKIGSVYESLIDKIGVMPAFKDYDIHRLDATTEIQQLTNFCSGYVNLLVNSPVAK